MARPLKQGLDYFPHDTDAINDVKIQRLILKCGIAGYGFYFALLAEIYSNLPAPYKWNENSALFCHKYNIRPSQCRRLLGEILKAQLFYTDKFETENVLISSSITERADTIFKAREIKRNWRTNSGQISGQTIGQTGESKGKSKEKKREDKEDTAISDESFSSDFDNLHPLKKWDGEQTPELTAVIDAFERCGGVVSSQMIALELADAEREYGADIVIAAFRRASLAGKSGTRLLAYCKPIYEDYKTNGIKDDKPNLPRGQPNVKLPSEPNPLKYTSGKYGHLFNRTKEDLERHAEVKQMRTEEENGARDASQS